MPTGFPVDKEDSAFSARTVSLSTLRIIATFIMYYLTLNPARDKFEEFEAFEVVGTNY